MALGLYLLNFRLNDVLTTVSEISLLHGPDKLTLVAFTTCPSMVYITRIHKKTHSVCRDNGLGREAHVLVINGSSL